MTDYGHELQFGTFLTPQNADPQAPVELAVLTEEVGLDLVTFQDHPYQPSFLDTWTLLSYVAARTQRVHLSGNVLNVPMRPPAVLARAAASLDLLSGGRAELGLGAGAFWDAIEAMGVPRLTPGEAVGALDEAIDVIRALWDTDGRGPLRVDGEHHRLAGAKRGPAPAHDIGIWVGAYKPRMLRLVGRKADGWLPSLAYMQPGDLGRANATIDEAATGAGRDPREIRRLLNIGGRFTPTPGGGLDGPPEQWVDALVRYALEDGTGTFVLATDDPGTIRTFAEQVAPAVRDAVAAERATSGTAAGPVRSAVALAKRAQGIAYDTVPSDVTAVEPGDRAYAGLRSTYMRRGAPGVVLLPRTTPQVVDALGWAREQHGPLGVRSGGHGISGRSTNDGGVLLDVGALDQVTVVDEAARRVRLGAGATWGTVAATLARRGWAISSGDYGGVGVGGLATTGGIGLLGRSYGLTIDHVVAYEVVTADGTVHVVDAEHEPELFWGLRGAGANLGVVTWVEIEAAEVPDVVYATMTFDASDPAGLVERWSRTVRDAPRQLTSFLHLQAGGGGRQPLAQAMTVWADDDTTSAVTVLEELLGAGPVLDQRASLTPYSGVVGPVAKHHDGGAPPVTRSGLLPTMTSAAAADLAALLGSGEAGLMQLRATGGAGNDVAPDATAYAHRHQELVVSAFAGRSTRAGLDDAWDRLAHPHMDGLYLSFETDPRPERLLEAFPQPTLDRLRALKRTYDPDHVFDQNFPIDPRG
ncbi:MAG: LLM class flavin-dependent oxidoreductase [Cellulomonas sp.]|jgi:alkanesulfonate monooxygenase SsuD/methylene tetrahydromethanopterin reductase-like flavin-dependent oxidoreductase (luciferase family)/FAD/FMN-containing dehydrogenase|uniref:LLM class flavin-dependent oxidoreductase n=1 Tax=Cellulomonas sp. TaxID=40001 RepID=UPI001A01CE32|nr:LLM class flavin-dependent oxidoreductase [Cellulomonas sp.]MBF0687383.1 LLM class flavin-dependent oxidoreductase [Cellulomonas sp.]